MHNLILLNPVLRRVEVFLVVCIQYNCILSTFSGYNEKTKITRFLALGRKIAKSERRIGESDISSCEEFTRHLAGDGSASARDANVIAETTATICLCYQQHQCF
jgi:hypothetical protein